MPVFSRRQLRQTLGLRHIRDTYVGATTQSVATVPYALVFMDLNSADLTLSGQNAYAGSWLRLQYLTLGYDLRVASFNAGSGAYISQQYGNIVGTIGVGILFERHDVISPTDKDRALDDSIKRLRVRREVGIDTVKDLTGYPMPAAVQDVLSSYYFASPGATLDRVRRELRGGEPVTTATGVEFRIDPALEASQQIVLDAITTVTLGADEDATVNIPDERLVLYGAEATCWDLMVRRAPRGTADEYRRLRDEAARQYSLLARNFKVPVDRPLRFDEVF